MSNLPAQLQAGALEELTTQIRGIPATIPHSDPSMVAGAYFALKSIGKAVDDAEESMKEVIRQYLDDPECKPSDISFGGRCIVYGANNRAAFDWQQLMVDHPELNETLKPYLSYQENKPKVVTRKLDPDELPEVVK